MGSECHAHPVLFDLGLVSFEVTPPHLLPRRYTYGKPVVGSVKAVFCRNAVSFYWYSREQPRDICQTYQLTVGFGLAPPPPPPQASANSCPRLVQTDKSGCASQTVDVGAFAPNKHMYVDRFDVSAELEEFGTGRPRPLRPRPTPPSRS